VSCRWDRATVVRALLCDPRVNVNLPDARGNTPLMVACLNGRTEAVRELLRSARVDLSIRNSLGMTAMNLAVTGAGKVGIVKWLLASRRVEPQDLEASLEIAKNKGDQSQVVGLLKRAAVAASQEDLVFELRKELGINGEPVI